jgi:hypothetical protein
MAAVSELSENASSSKILILGMEILQTQKKHRGERCFQD